MPGIKQITAATTTQIGLALYAYRLIHVHTISNLDITNRIIYREIHI